MVDPIDVDVYRCGPFPLKDRGTTLNLTKKYDKLSKNIKETSLKTLIFYYLVIWQNRARAFSSCQGFTHESVILFASDFIQLKPVRDHQIL